MKRTSLAAAAMTCIGLFAICSSVSASVSECDYSKSYNDPKTLYVSRDGSGDFNCDGVDDDIEINAAFRALENSGGTYTSVFLKSGNYIIGNPLAVASNSTFTGDEDTILKLEDHAGWKTISNPSSTPGVCANYFAPLIGGGMTGTTYKAVQNVEVECFTIDGNFDNNVSAESESVYYSSVSAKLKYNSCMTEPESLTDDRWMGLGYYTMMYFPYSSNISVHDMILQNSFTDGLKSHASTGVKFYDNIVKRLGHDGLFVSSSNGVIAHGNQVWARTNSAFRMQDTYDVSIFDNYITNYGVEQSGYLIGRNYGSGPGIELDKQKATSQMTNINVYGNTFFQTWGPGIWLAAVADPNNPSININHNIFYQAGQNQSIKWVGGIVSNNFTNVTVENNVFDESYGAALTTYPVVAGASSIVFQNNVVTNTHQGRNTLYGGYAIENYGSLSSITSNNNCFYNNFSGDYSGTVSIVDDIYVDPLFADAANHDYHLQSSWGRWSGIAWVKDGVDSPCIDAGSAASDYSRELEYNGGRINIGRYGNTDEASLSPVIKIFYSLTINGGSGSGSYEQGQAVDIVANTPVTGKVFDKWIGDVSCLSDVNTASAVVTMPDGAISLTATYKTAYYLTVKYGSGDGYFASTTKTTITADAPAAGKVFSKWIGDTAYVSSVYSATATVTMPSKAITLTASYKNAPTYYLTVNYGSGDGYYYAGKIVTVRANAAPIGKVFDKWIGDTAYIADIYSSTTTLTMPEKKIYLTATYRTK